MPTRYILRHGLEDWHKRKGGQSSTAVEECGLLMEESTSSNQVIIIAEESTPGNEIIMVQEECEDV